MNRSTLLAENFKLVERNKELESALDESTKLITEAATYINEMSEMFSGFAQATLKLCTCQKLHYEAEKILKAFKQTEK